MTTSNGESGDRRRDELIAGEYVLGVLSPEDRRKAEARMVLDRTFAEMVARWQQNLSSFDQDYGEEIPPSRVLSRIELQLFPEPAGGVYGLWNSLSFWRGLAAASLIVVAGLGVQFSGLLGEGMTGTPLIAELSGEGNSINLVAMYENGRLRLTPVAARQEEEKSLELWLVEDGGKTVSLGVLPQTGEGELSVPEAMQAKFSAGATLAVSIEPFGGSPTGVATGPVIAVGKARDF